MNDLNLSRNDLDLNDIQNQTSLNFSGSDLNLSYIQDGDELLMSPRNLLEAFQTNQELKTKNKFNTN